ncbi:MAG: phosphatidate cytidylyltransferase [Rhizobiaceae bacterium]|nr:phosphatidate cytidylyltransferase [Rhizobiaceae bacterium]MCV0407200.1 phosphatidate cytidylyltransferase [Rhizobiaceae bacterium]
MSDPAPPPGGKTRSNLQLRILSAVVLAAVTLALTWAGGVWFRVFAVAVMLLMFLEWSAMVGLKPGRPHHAFCWGGIVLVAGAVLTGQGEMAIFALILIAGLAALVSGIVFGGGMAGAGGLVYSGLSGACLSLLRGDSIEGLAAIVFLFAVVWGTDIFAYFVGRALGGPKLAPSISPGKTWSGAIGGLVAAMIFGVPLAMAVGDGPFFAAFIALTLSVVSQLGDLAESSAKRRYGVKDSGHIIPGHGGVMDRVDGLVAGAIALYVISVVFETGFAH